MKPLRTFVSVFAASALALSLTPAMAFAHDGDGTVYETADEVATLDADVTESGMPDGLDASVACEGEMMDAEADAASQAPAADDNASLMVAYDAVNENVAEQPAQVSASVHESETWAALAASGGLVSRASSVVFPVWSQAGGQDDIVWYDARRNDDGSWAAAVDIARHATAGAYDVNCYAVVDGAMVGVGEAHFEISAPTATVSLGAQDNGSYQVVVTGIASPSGVSAVKVPSWTAAGGQDDLVWYTADAVAGAATATWSCIVSASLHGGQDGAYDSHAYVVAGNGVMVGVGAVRAQVVCDSYIFMTGKPGTGKRSIFIKNPDSTVITMATWSLEGGQDDLMWTPAAYIGDQVWKADIACRDLKHVGQATTHVYSNGAFVGDITYQTIENDLIVGKYRTMYDKVQGLNSASHRLIAADTNNCFVGIYQGSIGNWAPIAYFDCTVGKPSTPTRRGIFTVGSKGYSFGTDKYTCYYFTQYSGDYLFHSVIYNVNSRVIQDGRLGMKLSKGCVRLAIENAKWIQDNVPTGSRVIVY